MLELKQCCKVPFPEKLFEEYEIRDTAIYANVNASKVLEMMKRFIEMRNEPLFFILELPCRDEDGITAEKTITNANDDYDVYFIDGLNAEQAIDCLNSLGSFLVKDGMNTFGIGGHESHEEILFGKYNVMTVYTKKADSYRKFFKEFGIKKVKSLVTAWDTFDPEHPGECERYISEETAKTIYDIPETYKEYGMYLYEARKEYDEAAEKEITFDELIGKVLLVGITYYTHDNEYIEQKQFYGTVTEANETIIRVAQKDGTEFTLPPDLSSTKRARKGEYKLRSTGEIVVDPDYLATWNLNRAKEN
ncbi:MAG: hypothetical protein IKU45_05340 [Clostridia bacterium]|nr:hypothetical protein [Clostridia bacterium]